MRLVVERELVVVLRDRVVVSSEWSDGESISSVMPPPSPPPSSALIRYDRGCCPTWTTIPGSHLWFRRK